MNRIESLENRQLLASMDFVGKDAILCHALGFAGLCFSFAAFGQDHTIVAGAIAATVHLACLRGSDVI